jgi:hypothetical protein
MMKQELEGDLLSLLPVVLVLAMVNGHPTPPRLQLFCAVTRDTAKARCGRLIAGFHIGQVQGD